MSAFTEQALIKKLADLNTSSQSIQTLSLWLIHHRKHHSSIVKIWVKELMLAQPSRKLVFMYLANDVIQNSKKKGPEYGNSFSTVLSKAFKDISQRCEDDKTFKSLDRILKIWEERGVYESSLIRDFETNLSKKNTKAKASTTSSATVTASSSSDTKNKEETTSRKRKSDGQSSNTNGSEKKRPKVPTPSKAIVVEVNGEKHVTLSPQLPVNDPPEAEDLIKMLQNLEEAASSDALTRERITRLPSEVCNLEVLAKIEDKDSALKLSAKVNDAVQLLKDYNDRLAAEMSDRNKLTVMLKDFQREQQELLTQAEQRLQEYTAKLLKLKEVQNEVKNHLENLPDIINLPDVTGGLAALPSAADLFNVHH